jgi:hypothetical protein
LSGQPQEGRLTYALFPSRHGRIEHGAREAQCSPGLHHNPKPNKRSCDGRTAFSRACGCRTWPELPELGPLQTTAARPRRTPLRTSESGSKRNPAGSRS